MAVAAHRRAGAGVVALAAVQVVGEEVEGLVDLPVTVVVDAAVKVTAVPVSAIAQGIPVNGIVVVP